MKRILRQGVLQARPNRRIQKRNAYKLIKFADVELSSNLAYLGSNVCFCDIPVSDLPIHMGKYSPFGIAFRKDFVVEHGAVPVMYIPINGRPSIYHFRTFQKDGPNPKRGISSQCVAFDRMWKYLNDIEGAIADLGSEHISLASNLRKLVSFLDVAILSHLKFFDHRLSDDDQDNFYMEREWRASQDVFFEMVDVQRIIVPTRFSQRFRRSFPSYDGEIFFAD